MMPFAPRNDVFANLVDKYDGPTVFVMTCDHASDIQGHWAFRWKIESDRSLLLLAAGKRKTFAGVVS
jgi:hypothetical protein